MEILFITHKYPPVIGGMEKHAFELLRHLEQNHTVHRLIYDNKEGRGKFFLSLPRRVAQRLEAFPNTQLIYFNEGLLAGIGARLKKHFDIPMVATVHGLDVTFPLSV